MQSPSGSHGRNLAILIAAEAVQKVLTVVLFVLISRGLSVEDNGRYGLFTTLFPLMVVWINMGMYDVAVRDIARGLCVVGRLIGAAEFLQMFLCISIIIPVMLLRWRQDGLLLASTAMVALFAANGRMFLASFAAADRFGPPALLQVALRAGALLASVAVLWANGRVLALVIVLLAPHALWVAAGRFWAWRAFGLVRPVSHRGTRHFLPASSGRAHRRRRSFCHALLQHGPAPPRAPCHAGRCGLLRHRRTFHVDAVSVGGHPDLRGPIPCSAAKTGGTDEGFALGRVFRAAWLLGLPMAVGGTVLAGPITVLLAGEKFLPGAYAVGGLTAAFALFPGGRRWPPCICAPKGGRCWQQPS